MNNNENEVYRIKRKYSPGFNLMKNGEYIVLFLIIVLAGFASYNVIIAILITLLMLFLFGALMFYNKKRALGTKIIFYETKLRFKARYALIDKDEIVLYKDIKDMSYFQTFSQKVFKTGDIRFYTKGFLNGLSVCDIPDIKENFEKIKEIINSTR